MNMSPSTCKYARVSHRRTFSSVVPGQVVVKKQEEHNKDFFKKLQTKSKSERVFPESHVLNQWFSAGGPWNLFSVPWSIFTKVFLGL